MILSPAQISLQAVTEWVSAGRVTVGADGRFDPRQAVASRLRTGDPVRLRAKVLQPLGDEVAGYRSRIVELEAALGESLLAAPLRAELAEARANAEFHEGAASELLEIFQVLTDQLPAIWHELASLLEDSGVNVIIGWLDRAQQLGVGGAGAILERKSGERCST